MTSQHRSLAPARSSTPPRRSLRSLTVQPGFRIKLKPRRDALTRVRHDLRSLLQSVVGYADLLAEPRYGTLSSEQERFVSHVRSAASHLEELVDTCIELSRPDNDNALEAPNVQLGQVLRRVCNTLKTRSLFCDLTLAPELELHTVAVDVNLLERAITGLVGVLTRDGAVALQLRVTLQDGRVWLTLHASDAPEHAQALTSVDTLEDQLGNRDFVRLKLSEVLLRRLGFSTRLGANVDCATLVF
ncbi:MAG TPA: histidine kinase dimerization/phospho-acceptor domain-containing protein [Polyangiales bacterium]|nr:histidine kinase dimerization/phospho-acceptor domain-containing protein [Polyangiales bacterium]